MLTVVHAECLKLALYAECHYADNQNIIMLSIVELSGVMAPKNKKSGECQHSTMKFFT